MSATGIPASAAARIAATIVATVELASDVGSAHAPAALRHREKPSPAHGETAYSSSSSRPSTAYTYLLLF